ncbi:MAG: serine/threonine protein kinase [Polyangiaceae bacterium]|nr:serine/threonine protein kinase [Polyangiaceae bacterium]
MNAVSRYDLLVKLASGGMGTVYVARVRGPMGFSRLVAIKRAHPYLADDPTFSKMLMDEAKLASRIGHPHIVSVLDVERVREGSGLEERNELRLVMDYIEGATLGDLIARAQDRAAPIPAGVAVRIALDAAAGLHAAHEQTDEGGEPLGIVHRDVSPHNILVGVDGMARVSDFGIAKATTSPTATTSGSLKGKLSYMAPEYVANNALDQRSDVFALGVVAWEVLAGRRLFRGDSDVITLQLVANATVEPLSSVRPEVGNALDAVLATALAKDPADRYPSARAFANALESEARSAGLVATHEEVAAFVRTLTKEALDERRALIRDRLRELEAAAPAAASANESVTTRASFDAAHLPFENPTAKVPVAPSLTPFQDSTLDGTNTTGKSRATRGGRTGLIAAAVVGVAAIVGVVIILAGRSDPAATAAAARPSSEGAPSSAAKNAAPVEVAPATAASQPPATTSASAAASTSNTPAVRPGAKPAQQRPPAHNGAIPPNPYDRR